MKGTIDDDDDDGDAPKKMFSLARSLFRGLPAFPFPPQLISL